MPKLTDTQLVMLSAAAQRADGAVGSSENLKGAAAQKAAARLLREGLVEEVLAGRAGSGWQAAENAKKAGGTTKAPKRQPRRKGAVGSRTGTKPAVGKQTKQQTCLDLLGRREGATIEELEEATGWQKHSVRGFLAGAVRKKLGLTLVSEKPDAGPRRYRIPNTA